jgi:hypothetical protein
MEGAWCAAARVIRNLLGPIRATWDDQAYDTTLINVRSKPLSPVVLGVHNFTTYRENLLFNYLWVHKVRF